MKIEFILHTSGNHILTELDMPVVPVGLVSIDNVWYKQVGDAMFILKDSGGMIKGTVLDRVIIVVKKADEK